MPRKRPSSCLFHRSTSGPTTEAAPSPPEPGPVCAVSYAVVKGVFREPVNEDMLSRGFRSEGGDPHLCWMRTHTAALP